MARNTSLYFRIVEGRNLPAKDVSGTSDPYCIVKVDNEVVARTATVWKNLSPFWGEEYTLHLPMGFHSLSFLVMDEDTIGHDDVIGKITLTKEAIGSQAKGIDCWLNLTRVDPDEEVQGEIHLSLELLKDTEKISLRCQVFEARDLAPRDISGTSDPFTRVIFNNHSAETSIIKKTRFPHWGETLELELDPEELREEGTVTVEVWDWDMVGKNDFLGKVEIPFACLHKTPPIEGWFRLLPLGNNEVDAGGKLGALRLKVRLVEDRILPSVYYQPLIHLLVESVISPTEVEDSSALTMLEEVNTVESRQDVAMTLVKIYLGQGLVVPFLDYLNTREVNHTTDPNTLFRSNSLSSKAMEQFMKDVKYLAISGFFFLRFFAPAILTPKLFQLRDQHADTRTSRTLLLLAKALQSVGNLGLQLGHGKEQWMEPLHPIILRSVSSVKDFLDKLIDIDHDIVSEVPQRAVFMPSVTVKEGYLHKHKAEGPQLLSRFAFKKRYFWLTSETLSYAKTPDWQVGTEPVRSSIPIQCVCAVERVDENAFQQQNVMQVITQDNDGQLLTMYIQCKNVNELNQWLSAIRKVSIYNERMLPSFHPGAHRSGKWTCCLQADRAVTGCSRTHSAVTLGDWSDPLDPDVEAQTIFKQLLQGKDKLRKKYMEMPDADQTSGSQESSHLGGAECNAQLIKPGQTVAARLLAVIEDLEQAHATFQRREKEDGTSVILNP
ncbi:rasGAP-activating-like protein 1 isoform X4 [Plectropomus leopardus]|uniref:rasGAP-activating-like protein 1 isoform X4 n=1 Tax=Plectropomus leopardus TaxID=160734 RepID=UPI001C4B328B|nr:rasGAP-activating-like protein 1 isoform X4 [Plectropomus leopardus]